MTLKALIPNVAELARVMGVSDNTVWRWITLDAVPPAKALDVAKALNLEPHQILPYARRRYTPSKTVPKTFSDLDALLAAYRGEPYETTLSPNAIKHALAYWGKRLPRLHRTLHQLADRAITLGEAAEALDITKSAVNQLRRRYGIAPGPRRRMPKAAGKVTQIAEAAPAIIYDVISGRSTAVEAARESGINLRTLHRHLARALRPLTLNEISHWSPAFRHALAVEIEKNEPKLSVKLRKLAENRGISLKKYPKRRKPIENYRTANVQSLMIDWLIGDRSIEELAHLRGGEPHMLKELFERQLRSYDIYDLPSEHHKAALGEYLIAAEGPYRTVEVQS